MGSHAVAGRTVTGPQEVPGPPRAPSPFTELEGTEDSQWGCSHRDTERPATLGRGPRLSLDTVVHPELSIMLFSKQFN